MATTNTPRRPHVSTHQAQSLLSDMYGLRVKDVSEMISFEDRNFRVVTENGDMFVLKIMNPTDSRDPDRFRSQISLISLLLNDGFWCPRHLPDRNGCLLGTTMFPVESVDGPVENCLFRLLTFLPGETLGRCPDKLCNTMYHRTGVLLAHLHKTLQRFPSQDLAVDPENEWSAENPERLFEFMTDLKDEQLAEGIKDIIIRVRSGLDKNSSQMDKGVIHGDFHDFNLIINRQAADPGLSDDAAIKTMFGIIDFNDICYTYRIFELGRLIADHITSCTYEEDALRIGGHVISGYLSVRDVSAVDMHMLYDAVCISHSQYIVLGEYAFSKQPDNPYTKLGSEDARRCLKAMLKMSQCEVEKMWWSVLMEYGINCVWRLCYIEIKDESAKENFV